jgi:hypothetical protein
MVVAYEMTALIAGIDESHTVDHIIESPFKSDEHVGPGDSLLPRCSLEKDPELFLSKTVHPLDLLFFSQLNAVIRYFAPPALGPISRGITPPIE